VIKPTSGFCLNLHHYLTFDESIEKAEYVDVLLGPLLVLNFGVEMFLYFAI
jgi:hypothetical protein